MALTTMLKTETVIRPGGSYIGQLVLIQTVILIMYLSVARCTKSCYDGDTTQKPIPQHLAIKHLYIETGLLALFCQGLHTSVI